MSWLRPTPRTARNNHVVCHLIVVVAYSPVQGKVEFCWNSNGNTGDRRHQHLKGGELGIVARELLPTNYFKQHSYSSFYSTC